MSLLSTSTQRPSFISVFTSSIVTGKENMMNHAKSPKMSTQVWYMSVSLILLLSKQVMWSLWILDVWSYPVLRRMGILWKSPVTIIFQIAFFLEVPFLVGSWLVDSYLLARSLWGNLACELCLWEKMVNRFYHHPLFGGIDYILRVKQLVSGVKQFHHVQN